MKPDWKDAPEWAQWLAMDEDGEWYWYENPPIETSGCWMAGKADEVPGVGRWALAALGNGWRESLERRP